MTLNFVTAKREHLWVKALLSGASGSGKTYSALRLATGLANGCKSRIAALDTENGRMNYYADEFDFDVIRLQEPFSPEQYIEGLEAAIDGGYKVIIIDSLSHEWKYINDIHDKMPGNSFTNWGKVKPRHSIFMEKILQSPIHIIATGRGKDEYVLEEKSGKQTPKKVGLGTQQEKDIEYNYTVTFNLAQDTHIADSTKDNTHIFEGRYEVLTEKDGLALYNWANEGDEPTPMPVIKAAADETDVLLGKIDEIKTISTSLIKNGVDKSKISEIIKATSGSANYNKINDLKTAEETLKKLGELK